MKNILIILFFIPVVSFSQYQRSGISVGVNFGKWIGNTDIFAKSLASEMNSESGFNNFNFNSASRIGISIAAFKEFPIMEHLSIQPEFAYKQRGITFKGDGDFNYGDSYSIKTDMIFQWDYIDFALLLKLPYNTGKIRPYLMAGPGAGYVISSKLKVNASMDGESDTQSEEYETDEKLDVNVNIGGGIDFSDRIGIELRYSQGFMQLFNEEDLEFHNGGLCLSLVAYF